MRHPRPLSALLSAVVAATVLGALPASAQARTWSVPSSAPAPVAAADASARTNEDLEDALMVRINDARADQGLRKIWSFDVCTDQLAERWGARIARTGRLEHRDQGEVIRRCDNSWAGETLVRGASLTPDVMVELWLNSPGHREILLSPRARRAGVAITEDSQGRMIGVVNLVRRS